jgi:hypothetical protein
VNISVIEISPTLDGARTIWQVGTGRHVLDVTINRHGPDLLAFDTGDGDVNTLFVFLDLWRPFCADLSAWLAGTARELPWTYCDFELVDLPERYRRAFNS